MDLLKEPLGAEGELVIKLSQGKLLVQLNHKHKSGSAGLLVEQDAAYFFDKLAAAIPGSIDDAVLQIIKGAVAALP